MPCGKQLYVGLFFVGRETGNAKLLRLGLQFFEASFLFAGAEFFQGVAKFRFGLFFVKRQAKKFRGCLFDDVFFREAAQLLA